MVISGIGLPFIVRSTSNVEYVTIQRPDGSNLASWRRHLPRMMEAAWSTLSSKVAATAMLALAAGTVRITAAAATARMRLFVDICVQSEAIDGPVYFGIFTVPRWRRRKSRTTAIDSG